MAKIVAAEAGFYRVPLPVVLTDSTHGEMRGFELNTVRLRGADGSDAQISSLAFDDVMNPWSC